jgi:hypothetical protein
LANPLWGQTEVPPDLGIGIPFDSHLQNFHVPLVGGFREMLRHGGTPNRTLEPVDFMLNLTNIAGDYDPPFVAVFLGKWLPEEFEPFKNLVSCYLTLHGSSYRLALL